MNLRKHGLLLLAIFLSSCATTTLQSRKTTRAIDLPEPEVKLVLTFTNEDIEVLGDIDISKEIDIGEEISQSSFDAVTIVKNEGIILSQQYLSVATKLKGWNAQASLEDQIMAMVLYEAISQYPTMDYILFPKVEVSSVSNSGFTSSKENSVKVRLRGRAVRIKF